MGEPAFLDLSLPCMLWPGAISSEGYGRAGRNPSTGRTEYAHQAAYRAFYGDPPAGTEIDHACHNADESCPGGSECPHRACFRAEHLAARTRRENFLAGNCRTCHLDRQCAARAVA